MYFLLSKHLETYSLKCGSCDGIRTAEMFRLFISRRSAASFALLSFIFLLLFSLLLLLSTSLVVWTLVDDDDDFATSNLLRDFDDDTDDFRCFREENSRGKREEAEEEADVTVGVLVLFACKKSDLVSILCDVSEEQI
jgi:hypothetical protein